MSENLAVATATPSFFFLVSETIILREYIKDLIFVVLVQRKLRKERLDEQAANGKKMGNGA